MKLFSPNAVLTPLARLIMDEDIAQLEAALHAGLDINAAFDIAAYVTEPPIVLALYENKPAVIKWLVAQKANLNSKEKPAIVAAAANCSIEIMELLLNNGAQIQAKDKVGKTAMNAALYNKRHDVMKFLLAHGYKMREDGISLRQVVAARDQQAVALLLAHGADVNFHLPDMVYPYNPSPVAAAAGNNDMAMVQLLVQHGADITVKDTYGERPYNLAVKNGNDEMIRYLAALEPAQWHNEEQRVEALKKFKLPAALLAMLRKENRRIELPGNEYVQYISFSSILDVKEVQWQKHVFLDLLSDVDNYGAEGFLVWYPRKKCLAFADYEHGEFRELCSVKEFFDDPGKQINKIFK